MRKLKLILGMVGIGLIQGCMSLGEDEYSCPGPGKGVTCSDSMDVYEMTNDTEKAREILRREKERAHGHEEKTEIIDLKISAQTLKPQMDPIMQPMPILKKAEVIRIWIAPWTDEKQDLNWPGFVFTEITPRRWSFGENEVKDTKVLTPVSIKK